LECRPGARVFGPAGVAVRDLEKVYLPFDSLEALRLLHLDGMSQTEAGQKLGISASTVSRMAQQGRKTLIEAVVHDKALCIEGGPVTVVRVGPAPDGWSPGRARAAGEGRAHADTSRESDTRQGVKMIIAVPYLQGRVNAHFGSTQAFLIARTADGEVEQADLYEIQGMQHSHSGIAGFLKDQGVEVILAGGMGAPMQQALKQAGFEVCCGVSGPAVEAVEAYLRGEIVHSEATCGHHHGEHQHAD
jgi:predicted Fe-Mo cluster-binding NifX family protein/predicted DNA-binding protein (UPF0251 family)